MSRYLTNDEFDERLKVKNSKIIRISDYVSSSTKIKFKCTIHNEVFLSRPNDILKGRGLRCCHSPNDIRNAQAANEYDAKLKIKNPNVVRLQSYITSGIKIYHKCLIHNEIYLARPDSCLGGKGLTCCGKINTLRHSVKYGKQPTELYLFNLRRFSGYVKVGISKNSDKRKDEEYGEQILIKRLNSRAEAYILEQAILQDKTLTHDCPEEMYLNRWPGWTEIRKCSEDVAKQVVESYLTELETLGLNVFAKKHLTLTRAEKALLDKKFPPL